MALVGCPAGDSRVLGEVAALVEMKNEFEMGVGGGRGGGVGGRVFVNTPLI